VEILDYQKQTSKTAIYKEKISEFVDKAIAESNIQNIKDALYLCYTALGLAGEAGEVANKIKKLIRDDEGVLTIVKSAEIGKELGDVLWYLAQGSKCLHINLDVIAQDNIDKLSKRKEEGTLQGSGDNR
jgi:NTP pyrophosphatase (non-canonical NTP hydrolase)